MDFSHDVSNYLIVLLKAAINGEAPPPVPEGLSLEELFRLAQFHSVGNMAYYALEAAGADIPPGLSKPWAELRDKAIMADVMFQADYEELSEVLKERGIRFLPLKGIIMKSLYPQSDYRTMSDIDILIDPDNAECVKMTMEELGYETEDFDHDVHDVYHKPPVTSIEVHRELFGAEGREYAPVFSDPWEMCRHDDGTWQFTEEAFFVFLLAHGMKHYDQGGTGIRTFMDIHIFMRHYSGKLDMERIFSMFDCTGQKKLCRDIVELSEMWFGDKERTDALTDMERYILSGGTYGTFSNQAENAVKTKGKAAYIWNKLFPDLKTMKQRYPVLKKAPVLLPVFWLVRMVTKPFTNRHENAEKLKALMKK